VKRYRAFTLIELLVVIAIIALLISILLPSLSRARELSKRTVCSANLRGIGTAYYLYAQDDPGVFPALGTTTGAPSSVSEGQVQLFDSKDRTTEPSTTGIPSTTVDMWSVVRANNSTPKQFICPSTIDTQDRATDTTAYFDFGSAGNLSYGYQYQHDPNRQIIGTSSEPTFPIMADANPYVKGGLISQDITNDRNSAFRGNSVNHTNREGQNVLFQDDHVTFEKSPDTGLSGNFAGLQSSRGRDNIYTVVANATANVDPGQGRPALNVGSNPEGVAYSGTCNLGSRSDACLIP
jgi:prepilin-type N-terminal cleavage/methylation domain-containing protein